MTWLLLIHDNRARCIFACCRLAHDGKCTNSMLQFLHRIDIDCFRFEFLFFLFMPSSLYIRVSIRVHDSTYLLSFVVLINCHSFVNYSCIFVLNSDPHACRLIKTCSFYNSQTCKQIMCSIRFRLSILCNKNAQN